MLDYDGDLCSYETHCVTTSQDCAAFDVFLPGTKQASLISTNSSEMNKDPQTKLLSTRRRMSYRRLVSFKLSLVTI